MNPYLARVAIARVEATIAVGVGCAALFALAIAGCVNGQLSPVVAPIVATVEQVACELVPILTGNANAGVVCKEIADLSQGIVNSLTQPPPTPKDAKPCKLVQIVRKGEGLGYLCDSFAGEVNGHLAGNPAALRRK